jgi:hypothetical protein
VIEPALTTLLDPACNVPALTVVPPPYVFAPERTSRPPAKVIDPLDPEITPANVPLALVSINVLLPKSTDALGLAPLRDTKLAPLLLTSRAPEFTTELLARDPLPVNTRVEWLPILVVPDIELVPVKVTDP